MSSKTRGHPDDPCRNCGDPTAGAFCPSCGQRKVDVRVSLVALIRDVVEDQFGVEQRTPATLRALLFRPGHLTREYLGGRVARYIRPFKLYLLSSLVLFLLVGIVSARGVDGITWGPGALPPLDAETQSLPERDAAAPSTPVTPDRALADSVLALVGPGPRFDALNVNTGNPRIDAILQARVDRLGRMEPAEALREVIRTFLNYTPTLLFVLLPVFAGILKLLYVRHRRFYVEHFVFVLHNHAFLFGIFTLALLASLLNIPVVRQLLALWSAVYFYLAMRRVYGQEHGRTMVKYGVLAWCYLMVLGVSVPVMVILSLLLAG